LGILGSMSLIVGLILILAVNVMAEKKDKMKEKWVRMYQSPSGWAASINTKAIDLDSKDNVFRQGYEKYEIDGQTRQRWVVIKYNKAGVEKWIRTWEIPDPGGGWAQAASIMADGTGGAYVSGGVITASPRATRVHTIRYDTYGDVIWERDYTPPIPEGEIVLWNTYCQIYNPGSEEEYLSVAGTFFSPASGECGIYIFKYSSDGEILEGSEHILFEISDYAALFFDDYGNLYVSSDSVPADNRPNQDIITRKYDPDMNLIWECVYNSPYDRDDTANTVHVDSYGYVYLGGMAATDEIYAPYPQYPWYQIPVINSVAIKVNPSGNLVWGSLYAAPDSFRNTARVVSDSEGNAYLTGYHRHKVSHNYDTHLVKFTEDSGTIMWAKLYESPAYDMIGDLAVDEEDNVINSLQFENNAFVQKVTPQGNVLWEYTYPNGTANGSILDSSGDLYICGISNWTILTIKLNLVKIK
jgi:hypothetical protein